MGALGNEKTLKPENILKDKKTGKHEREDAKILLLHLVFSNQLQIKSIPLIRWKNNEIDT